MGYTYTATIGSHGIKMTRKRDGYGASSADVGFQHFDLPTVAAGTKITQADIVARLAVKGYAVSGEWSSNQIDGATFFTVAVVKTSDA